MPPNDVTAQGLRELGDVLRDGGMIGASGRAHDAADMIAWQWRQLASMADQAAVLLAACEAFMELYRDSDMRPEEECAAMYARMSAAIARVEAFRAESRRFPDSVKISTQPS